MSPKRGACRAASGVSGSGWRRLQRASRTSRRRGECKATRGRGALVREWFPASRGSRRHAREAASSTMLPKRGGTRGASCDCGRTCASGSRGLWRCPGACGRGGATCRGCRTFPSRTPWTASPTCCAASASATGSSARWSSCCGTSRAAPAPRATSACSSCARRPRPSGRPAPAASSGSWRPGAARRRSRGDRSAAAEASRPGLPHPRLCSAPSWNRRSSTTAGAMPPPRSAGPSVPARAAASAAPPEPPGVPWAWSLRCRRRLPRPPPPSRPAS
mmetsp:Transcript_91624/g.290705  ORF Transcript_91624/g.290705 Transcript_91624/m.290705 type:complete len:275 (+) Transcript_91624:121-945(+)